MQKSILSGSLLLSAVQLVSHVSPFAAPIPPQTRLQSSPPSILLSGNPFEHESEEEEKEFTIRLNKLVEALHGFSSTYNAGHVVDVRKVRAVRKAWLELEKTGWFRAEKPR